MATEAIHPLNTHEAAAPQAIRLPTEHRGPIADNDPLKGVSDVSKGLRIGVVAIATVIVAVLIAATALVIGFR